jgi:hypothetical protein
MSPPCPTGDDLGNRTNDTTRYLKEGFCSYSKDGYSHDTTYRKTGLTEVEFNTLSRENLVSSVKTHIPTYEDYMLKGNNISVY